VLQLCVGTMIDYALSPLRVNVVNVGSSRTNIKKKQNLGTRGSFPRGKVAGA
jgi:hypothetical protein